MNRQFWNFIELAEDIELRIDGDIVDDGNAWLYDWFGEPSASPNRFRKKLREYEGKNLKIWIDSYGGDIVAAAGMYHALSNHKGKKTVIIDSKAMSAASVLAMAGDTILIDTMGVMMIHNPWVGAQGDEHVMTHTAEVLKTIKETIINAYAKKTKRSRCDISAMMDNETWMDAKEAISQGFVDGMYKEDDEDEDDIKKKKKAYAFASTSFQNSADEKIKKMMEIYMQKNNPNPQDTQLPLVNLYQAQILLNRRINNV